MLLGFGLLYKRGLWASKIFLKLTEVLKSRQNRDLWNYPKTPLGNCEGVPQKYILLRAF